MRVENSANVTKKDIINMGASSKSLKDAANGVLTIKAAAICIDADEDGVDQKKGFLVTTDGLTFGTLSPTAIRTIDGIVELLTDEPDTPIEVRVEMSKSKNDRDFLTLTLL